MKTTRIIIVLLASALGVFGQAITNLQYVDVTTPHTNTTYGGGTSFTLQGVKTNTPYFWTNTANVYYGDDLATAFTKINNDIFVIDSVFATAPFLTNTGLLFPSNSWNLTSITNNLNSGDIITVNSNGQTLIDVWMSNGVPVLKPHW